MLELTRQLIAIDSVNPDLVPGGAGEQQIAEHTAALLAAHGFQTRLLRHASRRSSVLAVAPGSDHGRSIMLNGHLDTVSLDSYDGDGLEPVLRGGCLYGRGAYDMKSGVAAAIVAATTVAARPHTGDIVLALVADEEYGSAGTEQVLRECTTDTAIVVEPSGLDIVTAHRGFVWADVTIHGTAAHGSRRDLGNDAISAAGAFLTGIGDLDAILASGTSHPLLGTGSTHASIIRGGTEASTYPDHCTITLERRTLPGEDTDTFTEELTTILRRLERADPRFRWSITAGTERAPFAAGASSLLVPTLAQAVQDVTGTPALVRGELFWTDCALLQDAGIDTALIGVDGGGAHADKEWVTQASLRTLVDVLVATVQQVVAH